MLPWQTNKMVTGHKTHELGRQSSNDHNCQIWFISLWEFSVAMATKPKGRLADFYLFSISLTPLTFAPHYSPTASVVLEEKLLKQILTSFESIGPNTSYQVLSQLAFRFRRIGEK